ncbi:hypothetical protein [Moraxella pluranimalium]|uniref:Uncharacterized protein n=1 Tax=Moraxella pluranimalium TaxID=470453 RepID=A0A1T0CUB6_9GAMM|nr:hypothetical protein [Moraxella pluranimalium]OOS25960.1 hypothetical protein B0680_00960 [Moraxella pluranimalium]
MPPKKSNPSSKSVALKACKLMDTAVVHSPSPMLIHHYSMMVMLASTATYAPTWLVPLPMSTMQTKNWRNYKVVIQVAILNNKNQGLLNDGLLKWEAIYKPKINSTTNTVENQEVLKESDK